LSAERSCSVFEIQRLLLDVLDRLGVPPPKRQISIARALRVATALEWLYRLLRLSSGPPKTRFAVGVFAYSKTFDAGRMLRDLGQPSVSLDEGIECFIAWQRERWSMPTAPPSRS